MIGKLRKSWKWKIGTAVIVAIILFLGIYVLTPIPGHENTADACGFYRDSCEVSWWSFWR